MQGVALHPQMKLVATASSDATVRIYKNRKLKNQLQFFHKFTIKTREDLDAAREPEQQIVEKDKQIGDKEKAEETVVKKKNHRMFLDDTEYTSFVRRLAWSPDGTFMLTPGSWYQDLKSQN